MVIFVTRQGQDGTCRTGRSYSVRRLSCNSDDDCVVQGVPLGLCSENYITGTGIKGCY